MSISVAPDGTEYSFPTPEDDKQEFEILKTLSERERKSGRKIVVVQGMGFVGSVMAAVVADMRIEKDLSKTLFDAEIVVFAVGHKPYKALAPEDIVQMCGRKPLIVDCSNFLTDEKIMKYIELGCNVIGVGKGHIKNLKKNIKK